MFVSRHIMSAVIKCPPLFRQNRHIMSAATKALSIFILSAGSKYPFLFKLSTTFYTIFRSFIACELMPVNYKWILPDKILLKNKLKTYFIFDKPDRNNINENKVVDTLWRIQVSRNLHQNICLQWIIIEWWDLQQILVRIQHEQVKL